MSEPLALVASRFGPHQKSYTFDRRLTALLEQATAESLEDCEHFTTAQRAELANTITFAVRQGIMALRKELGREE